MCPLDGRVEDHSHVLKRCYFSAFMPDTVRNALGLVQGGGQSVEPSRLLLEEAQLSLQCTQGLALLAGLWAQWKLRCEVKYQRTQATLHNFVALWVSILEGWRGQRNMPCSRADLHYLIGQLQTWGESGSMFQRVPTAPTAAPKPSVKPDPVKL